MGLQDSKVQPPGSGKPSVSDPHTSQIRCLYVDVFVCWDRDLLVAEPDGVWAGVGPKDSIR